MLQPKELEAGSGPALKNSYQNSAESSRYKRKMWELFKEHHYMSGELSTSATCAVARWGSMPIGFIAVLVKPGRLKEGDDRLRMREHRLVVHPEFQGIGVGTRLSAATGSRYLSRGMRYSSKSASHLLREHRRESPLWLEVESMSNSKATGIGSNIRAIRMTKSNPRGKQTYVAAKEQPKHKGEAKEQDGLYSFEYVGTEDEQIRSHYLARGGDIERYMPPPTAEARRDALAAASAFLRGSVAALEDEDGEDGDGEASVASESSAGSKKRKLPRNGGGGARATVTAGAGNAATVGTGTPAAARTTSSAAAASSSSLSNGKAKATDAQPSAKKAKSTANGGGAASAGGGIASFFKPSAGPAAGGSSLGGAGSGGGGSSPWTIAAASGRKAST